MNDTVKLVECELCSLKKKRSDFYTISDNIICYDCEETLENQTGYCGLSCRLSGECDLSC